MPNRRRIASTTSWDVGPAGLSMTMGPARGVNFCLFLPGIQTAVDSGDDLLLDGQRRSWNTRAGGRGMASTAKFSGDFIYVHFLALGTQADASQFGLQFLKHTRDNHRLDGADMIDEALGVAAIGAGTGEIGFLEPEVSDLIVVRESE